MVHWNFKILSRCTSANILSPI